MITVAEIKSALHEQIANTQDEKVLLKMQDYFQSLAKSDKRVVAYTAFGKALTAKLYKAEVEIGMIQHKQGRVKTQREMEKGL